MQGSIIFSRETHLLLFQFCITYMARPRCRVLQSMGRVAIWALKDADVGGTDFNVLSGIVYAMSKRRPALRRELFDDAMDYMHDFLCSQYPDQDDGERYWDWQDERGKRYSFLREVSYEK